MNKPAAFVIAAERGCLLLERLPRVIQRTGLSRSEIYRRISDNPPQFPVPVKIGVRASAWDAAEISGWIAERIAERDARAAS